MEDLDKFDGIGMVQIPFSIAWKLEKKSKYIKKKQSGKHIFQAKQTNKNNFRSLFNLQAVFFEDKQTSTALLLGDLTETKPIYFITFRINPSFIPVL